MKKRAIAKPIKIFTLIIAIIFFLNFAPVFGRFIYKELKNYYFNTKKFYFESDKLSENLARIELDHWNGVDTYNITINLNSFKNSLLKSDSDIDYDITYRCSNNISCASSKTSGTIYSATNTDNFIITLSPITQLKEKDTVWMEVEATSSYPYEKTLKGRFVLQVGFYGLAYEISDQEDDLYLELKITNTLDYYTVETAFDSFSIGDRIDISTYLGLSEENKQKCASAIIDVSFDPNIVLLDLTDTSYQNALSTTTTTINNYDYITQLSFKIDAISSKIIRFYKKDPSQNYTYPNDTDNSILDITFN